MAAYGMLEVINNLMVETKPKQVVGSVETSSTLAMRQILLPLLKGILSD